MSIFVNPSETIVVNFDDGPLAGEWIKIRARLSGTERKRLASARFNGVRPNDGEGEGTVIEVDFTRDTSRRLLAWLVGWSFTDERGRVAPITDKTIGLLDEAAVDAIEGAIDAREAEIADEAAAKVNPLPASSPAPTPTAGAADDSSPTIEPPTSGDA